MDEAGLDRRRFPIGRAPKVAGFRGEDVARGIEDIESLPVLLRAKVAGLAGGDLQRTYRPGGWTVRQVIHHVADSHVNSYVRLKLALTEVKPTIKPYFEERWAELADGRDGDIRSSLSMLDGIHARWAALLRTLGENDLRRSFIHPEMGREVFLFENVSIYSWHGRHHLAHIDLALEG